MTAALLIKDLKKTYQGGVQALKGINLEVVPGDFYALLGPNGAGKSTTIGIVSSLVRKTSGHVSIFGYDIDTHLAEAKQQLGVVPQEFNFGQFEKVIDIVANQAGYYGIESKRAYAQAEKYIRQLGLWDKRNQAARMLSGGMKRRLMIARALVHEPRLLILDEPTAGVDIELRRSMWEFLSEINQKGTTIILTTHYLEEAESLCRNIAIIDKGLTVENTDMKSLLSKLNCETFVFDLREAIRDIPFLEGYAIRKENMFTLEVDVAKTQSLNEVFRFFDTQGISVVSMRTKSNRLEELFVSLVEKDPRKDLMSEDKRVSA